MIFFRLEPVDSNYGDDTDDKTGRYEFRLHKPGGTIGCITLLNENEWNEINQFIKNTTTSVAELESKSRNPLKRLFKEEIINYGTLTVI